MAEINQSVAGNRPVLALDVDGVFIVYAQEAPSEDYAQYPGAGSASVRYNPKHGTWIRELLPFFDAVYMTSHCERSHEDIGQHLALPELDWVNFRGHGVPGDTSLNRERRAALDDIFIDRPLVWVDDDMEPRDFAWARRRSETGIATLAIQPISEIGLQRHHIDEVHHWLGELAAV